MSEEVVLNGADITLAKQGLGNASQHCLPRVGVTTRICLVKGCCSHVWVACFPQPAPSSHHAASLGGFVWADQQLFLEMAVGGVEDDH